MTGDRERLEAIANFLPLLKAPSFSPGEIVPSRQIDHKTFTLPFSSLTPQASRFHEMLYEKGWISNELNWSSWADTEEAKQLRRDNAFLMTASVSQLENLLTSIARADRFSDGTLLEAFQSGLILRIVERANAILQEMQLEESAAATSPIVDAFVPCGHIRLSNGDVSCTIEMQLPRGNALYALRQDSQWLYFGSAKRKVADRISSYVRHQRSLLSEANGLSPVRKRRAMHGLLAEYLKRGEVEILIMPLSAESVEFHSGYPFHMRLGLEHGLICVHKPPLNVDTVRREC